MRRYMLTLWTDDDAVYNIYGINYKKLRNYVKRMRRLDSKYDFKDCIIRKFKIQKVYR